MFSKLFSNCDTINILKKAIDKGERVSVFGCGLGEKIAISINQNKFILFVANDLKEVENARHALDTLGLRVGVITNNYTLDLFDLSDTNEQIFTQSVALVKGQLDALIITPNVLNHKFVTKDYIEKNNKTIAVQKINFDGLLQLLISYGYKRVDFVTKSGEFSVRGEIVDVFGEELHRLFFEFDDLVKIKLADSATMLTIKDKNEFNIVTKNYLAVDIESAIKKILANNQLKENFQSTDANYLKELSKNCFWFLPFASNFTANIFDLIGSDTCVVFSDVKNNYFEMLEAHKNFLELASEKVAENKLLLSHKKSVWSADEIKGALKNVSAIAFQHLSNANNFFAPNRVFNFSVYPKINYSLSLKLLATDAAKYADHTFVVFVRSNEGAVKIKKLLGEQHSQVIQSLSQIIAGSVNLVLKDFPLSFSFASEKIFVVGSNDLFGSQPVKADSSFSDVFMPATGDIVVHQKHGLGRCLGINSLNMQGSFKDYVVIEYKFGDKLFVPVENMDSLSKYLGVHETTKLNKIGGVEFAKTKNAVRENLKKLTVELLAVYAERLQKKGYIYPADDEMQEAFEKSFSFTETQDQLAAINDIKNDMQTGRVMDRLICGDVGFGKTEVALRAAFKTIFSGKQVAFLCPTTILSQQHYNTALVRMENFGVRVAVLNRFKTAAETEQIIKQLAAGDIDLVVGTHKLLNKNIRFKNLGLLILDEEQKFGVEDKEKIKLLKSNVNVLTLSATPIPRTLHMSMVGIRDISVIETPPLSRLATAVQVVEYSPSIILSAIVSELKRQGQVLIVYNRVESIYAFTKKIRDMLDDKVVVDIAHGQMQQRKLEDAIFRLYNRETDVLIATTLIENGIDLPNANTLIVVDADNLGLSQLYQLKGRIGRSDRQSYAYFTYNSGKLLTENAYKRLQAITQYTELSSGYKIALKDLEIRGAGNVLGTTQHGHLQKVGYAMYVELLQKAIDEIKGKGERIDTDVKISYSKDAFIPHYYIENGEKRMELYRKISKIENEAALIDLTKKIEDIYGLLPSEIQNICKLALIKNHAKKKGVEQISINESAAVFYFVTKEDLLNYVAHINNKLPHILLEITSNTTVKIFAKNNRPINLDAVINAVAG